MRSLHLVDGTWELFRSHFSSPSRQAPDGQEVAAVWGLCGSLLALLRRADVTHVAVATDHVIESFRNDLFDGYKTSEGIEETILAQFELAEEAMRAMGLVVWPMVEFEADDALASAAARYAPDFDQVVIATPDKDLAQCVVGTTTVQWNRMTDVRSDAAGVLLKFGVPPASIPDYLALVGDKADGIPGLKGFGAKSSATLLAAYGTLEAIPDDPAAWSIQVRGAARLAETLRSRREEAGLYKRLATLRRDVSFEEAPEDLTYRGTPEATWRAFCARRGWGRLADRPDVWI